MPQDGISQAQLAAIFSSLQLLRGLEHLALLRCDLSSLPPTLVTEVLLAPRQLFLRSQVVLTKPQLLSLLEGVGGEGARLELLSVRREDFSLLPPSILSRALSSLREVRLGGDCSLTPDQSCHLLHHLTLSPRPLADLYVFQLFQPLLLQPLTLAKALCSLVSLTLAHQLDASQLYETFTLLASGTSRLRKLVLYVYCHDPTRSLLSLTPPKILGQALSALEEAKLPGLHFSASQLESILVLAGGEDSRLQHLDLGEDVQIDHLPLEVLRPATRRLGFSRFKGRLLEQQLIIHKAIFLEQQQRDREQQLRDGEQQLRDMEQRLLDLADESSSARNTEQEH